MRICDHSERSGGICAPTQHHRTGRAGTAIAWTRRRLENHIAKSERLLARMDPFPTDRDVIWIKSVVLADLDEKQRRLADLRPC